MAEVECPADVEAATVAHFKLWNIQVSTRVYERSPGMVRASRTGGGLTNVAQDKAEVLFEVWDSTSVQAWATAIRVWAILRLAAHYQEFNGAMLYDADVDVPRTLDDDLAPDLHRVQFLAVLTVPLTVIVLEEP